MTQEPRSGALGELDPLIGLTISGRYRVHALIGQGGMGKVFQAQQIPLGRAVALKVLDARKVDREFHRRFFQEAAILAKLKSRHTVTIYDYGRDGDFYFIAMELVSGQSLDRVLTNEAPLAVPRVLVIAEHVCRSLREAHSQGVIHRDLKPGNVMLTRAEDGEELAKVLDFGLAKRVDRGSREDTQPDTVPGSPKYMAPEVVRQQPIDGRADMYGLGVMLYYMLTGGVPFDRENPLDILRAHLHETPRPLRVANPKLDAPDALEHVVMRCLAKTPNERFANMQELLDNLQAISRNPTRSVRPNGPTSARPNTLAPGAGAEPGPSLRLEARDVAGPSQSSMAAQPSSRGARGVWAGALFLALALIGLVVWRVSGSEAAPEPQRAAPTPAPATPPASGAAPAAPVPSAVEPPNMVFTQEEAAAGAPPRVTLHVSSEPPGAAVFVRGTWVGTTPAKIDWQETPAQKGRPLAVQLKLDGYRSFSFKRAIDGPEMQLSAKLEPISAVPASAAPAEDDLRAIEARARALQGAPPAPAVLKITPAEPPGEAPPSAPEPKTAEPNNAPE